MIRAIALILLTTISVHGQDSTLVREFCKQIGQSPPTRDTDSTVLQMNNLVQKYLQRSPMTGDNPVQDALRFQYRLMRELKKSCPHYSLHRIELIPKAVFDLENNLTKHQIDSLATLTSQIKQDKKVHLFIVTIDDFYPDNTITDFSNRYREFWAPRNIPDKGVILIVLSISKRAIKISTGDISMTHLTDAECSEVVNIMIPYSREQRYFNGLVAGLLAIESRL